VKPGPGAPAFYFLGCGFSVLIEQRGDMTLQPGLYRHYKGPEYRVIGVARHSETEEEMVVYQALYGEFGFWVRPLSLFCETVDVDGEQVPRFALIRADAASFEL